MGRRKGAHGREKRIRQKKGMDEIREGKGGFKKTEGTRKEEFYDK